MRDNQKVQDKNGRRERASTSSLFVSPEAVAVKAQLLDSGEDFEKQDSKDGSEYYGLDVPLSVIPSTNRSKKKETDINDIVECYSTPGKPVHPIFRTRWRKLQICASFGTSLKRDKKGVKSVKPNSDFNKNLEDKGSSAIRIKVPPPTEQIDEQCTVDNQGDRTEDGYTFDEDDCESSESFANEPLRQFSKTSRFGRRLSLPVTLPSSSNLMVPTPPATSPRSEVSSGMSFISPRRLSSCSRSDSDLDIRQICERHLSLRSNLEVNRTIVSELIQERSTAISNLSLISGSDDAKTSKKEDITEYESSRLKKGRLLDRRASGECVSSLEEFKRRVSM